MVRDGFLAKATEDLYFHAPSLDNLKRKLVDHLLKHAEIDMPAFKDLTGLSRKFTIPLLEYFDKTRVTMRVGDKRILREKQHQ